MIIRLFRKDDIPSIVALLQKKAAQVGIDFWLPSLERARCVFVAEDNGQVCGCMVFQDVVEMMLVADDPRMVNAFMTSEAKIRCVLNRVGVDNMISFVPRELMNVKRKSGMQRILERLKFRRIDDKFACFEGEVYSEEGT